MAKLPYHKLLSVIDLRGLLAVNAEVDDYLWYYRHSTKSSSDCELKYADRIACHVDCKKPPFEVVNKLT